MFAFPDNAIGTITSDHSYVRRRGGSAGLEVSNPPHIIVDAARRFAVYSDEFIAVPPRQIGITGHDKSATALRALSLYLSSDFIRYHQFFNAPKWGVDESLADLDTLKRAPVPITGLSESELREWGELQTDLASLSSKKFAGRALSSEDERNFTAGLSDLNERVFKLLGLKRQERWLVNDFVHLHLQLNKGKVTPDVLRQPKSSERQEYLVALRDCLDGFFSSERKLRHRLTVLADYDSAMLSIGLTSSTAAIEPSFLKADDPSAADLKVIRDSLRSRHSQWVYFDRALKMYDQGRGVLYQFKPLQRLYWTRRQAVLDADDIIAETLAEGGGG
jgi:hypothetical protein